jgi:hypothetical protein
LVLVCVANGPRRRRFSSRAAAVGRRVDFFAFRSERFFEGILMNELITGVVLETLCAIIAASYFVAECAMQEAKIPVRKERRDRARP